MSSARMTSSESEGQPPRKRSRGSKSSEDGPNKKSRGRPRVDTQDATAADRRRTQIRLAQRAYRQRKESTISSLQKENNQLQSIIQRMNQSFIRFNDSIVKTGLLSLNTDLARELKDVTETFVHLAQSANPDDGEASDEAADAEIDPPTELYNASTAARTVKETQLNQQLTPILGERRDISAFTDSTTLTPSHATIYDPSTYFPNPPHDFSNGSRHLVRTRPSHSAPRRALDRPKTTEQLSASEPLPFGLVELLMREPSPKPLNISAFPTMLPSPNLTPPPTRVTTPPSLSRTLESVLPMTKTLHPPYTYSFQESTFARRMTRAAIEAGFKLLSQTHLHPTLVKEVFRLSLPFNNVDQLLARFKSALTRGPYEDIDCWEAPFIHLGGAGTHYPRKDAYGNVIPIPNSWTVRSIGPLKKTIIVENPTDPPQYHSLPVDMTGLEGDWFDAHDVQGYLEQAKGLFINPQDSFAECLMEMEEESDFGAGSAAFSTTAQINLLPDQSPTLSHASRSSTSPASDSSATSLGSGMGKSDTVVQDSEASFGLDIDGTVFNQFGKLSDMDFNFDQPLGLDMGGNFTANTGYGGNIGLNFERTAEEALPVVKQKRKRPVLVDVGKLIEEVVSRGVCLGRAPGFRKRDVDLAVKIAVIQVF